MVRQYPGNEGHAGGAEPPAEQDIFSIHEEIVVEQRQLYTFRCDHQNTADGVGKAAGKRPVKAQQSHVPLVIGGAENAAVVIDAGIGDGGFWILVEGGVELVDGSRQQAGVVVDEENSCAGVPSQEPLDSAVDPGGKAQVGRADVHCDAAVLSPLIEELPGRYAIVGGIVPDQHVIDTVRKQGVDAGIGPERFPVIDQEAAGR